jgi:hypothetical protein
MCRHVVWYIHTDKTEFCKAWYHKFCESTYFRSEEKHSYTLQQNNPAYYGICLAVWWDYTHPGSKSLGSTLMAKHDYQVELWRLCWNTRTIVLLEKLTGSQPVKKFPTFYGTPKVHYHIYYRSLSSCSFLHSPVTSSLLGPNTKQPIAYRILSHWQMSQNFKSM